MCEYWSGIVSRDGEIYFCEDDSHEETIARMKAQRITVIDDGSKKNFVRIECKNGEIENFKTDEEKTPSWFVDIENAIHREVEKVLTQTNKARSEYNAIDSTAWSEYNAIDSKARSEYNAIKSKARSEYNAIESKAWSEYITKIKKIEGYISGSSD